MAKTAAARNLGDAAAFGDAVVAALSEDAAGAVLQIDLDGLSELNRVHGRKVGDQVIAAAAGVLERTAAAQGWAAAHAGGDQFEILVPGASLEQAFLAGERLRNELNAAVAGVLPEGASCTTSIGVAAAPRDAKQPEELVRKAGLALYAAKEQGGNVVALTPGDEMVLKTSYYPTAQLARLRTIAERLKKKEAVLLREALDDLLRKYDRA